MSHIDVRGIMFSDLDDVSPQESQDWVRFRVAAVLDGDHYAEEMDSSILGEDDRGLICAAVPGGGDEFWELFDVRKAAHREAATETLRRGRICFLDLDYES